MQTAILTIGLFVASIILAFAIVYQDWWLPRRRKANYEEMRRSVKKLKETEFYIDHSGD